MKRTAILVAGVMALSFAIYVSDKLAAQTTPPAAAVAQPKTKVGLLNLTYVVKNYKKFQSYQEELKTLVTPFQKKDAEYKGEGEKLAKEAGEPKTTQERRDAIERRLKELQRSIEDNKNDAQKVVVKKQEDQLKTLYMDVRSVTERYAQAHGFEMILHYNDAVTAEEYWSAPNIARKMQAGALMPLYIANGLDVSANVVTTLNQQFGAVGAATPAGSR